MKSMVYLTKFKPVIHLLVVISLIISSILLAGCSHTIPFETIVEQGYQSDRGEFSGRGPHIRVITDVPNTVIRGISSEYMKAIQAVNYSQYAVVIVVYGTGTIFIKQVTGENNYINIRTRIIDSVTQMLGICYEIIKIKKTDIRYQGRITFRLFDESGHEWEAATHVISS